MTFSYQPNPDLLGTLVLVGLGTVFCFVLLTKIFKFIRRFIYFQKFPGEAQYSILLGNIHLFPKKGEDRLVYGNKNMYTRDPKLVRVWWGPVTVNLVVYHPETVKVIYKSSAALKPRGFGQSYQHAIPWIGEGLISSNGGTWARSRRLLTPAFHFDILKPYVQIYNKAADTLFEKLDKLAATGESFDIWPHMTLCTLEIILKCAMSYDVDIQRKGHPYAKAVQELLEGWFHRSRTPLLWPDFIFRLTSSGRKFKKNCDYVHKVAEEVISQRKRQLQTGEGQLRGRHLDFLDILLSARDDDGNPMSLLEIRNEVDTFLFAGHDTTAAGAPWILYTLAKHPEYQRKVQEEVDSVLEGRDSDYIQWSDIANLQTLHLCIKETLRLYPPVPFIQRTLTEPLELDGRKIPADTTVTIAIVHLHRNPLVWKDPHDFQPERFLPENIKDRDSFAFTPFSAGSRNCIGQNFALNEEKVLIARFLHRYHVELAPDAPPVERSPSAILKTEKGIWLKLSRRHLKETTETT